MILSRGLAAAACFWTKNKTFLENFPLKFWTIFDLFSCSEIQINFEMKHLRLKLLKLKKNSFRKQGVNQGCQRPFFISTKGCVYIGKVYNAEAGSLNINSCLAPTLGLTKFTHIRNKTKTNPSLWGRFVKQMLMLTSNFRFDQIYIYYRYPFGQTFVT